MVSLADQVLQEKTDSLVDLDYQVYIIHTRRKYFICVKFLSFHL